MLHAFIALSGLAVGGAQRTCWLMAAGVDASGLRAHRLINTKLTMLVPRPKKIGVLASMPSYHRKNNVTSALRPMLTRAAVVLERFQ